MEKFVELLTRVRFGVILQSSLVWTITKTLLFPDMHQVTITGAVPAEATKLIFSTDSGTFKTFFSADGKGSLTVLSEERGLIVTLAT